MHELEHREPSAPLSYDHRKPALLFGSDPVRNAQAMEVLAAASVRLVDRLPLAHAGERLDLQPSLGLAWLELGEDDMDLLPPVLDRLEQMAESRDTAVIAAGTAGLIDLLAARLTHPRTQILIEPDEAECLAALAIAQSGVDGKIISSQARVCMVDGQWEWQVNVMDEYGESKPVSLPAQ